MSRDSKRRYLVGAFLPGMMAVVLTCFFAWLMNEDRSNVGDILGTFILFSIFGVPLSLLPAALYSYLMEQYVNPRVLLNFDVVFLSTCLGTLAGALFVVMLPVGTLVGFIVGIILRYDYMRTTYSGATASDKPVRFILLSRWFGYGLISLCYLCWFSLGMHVALGGWSGIMSLLLFATFLGCLPYLALVFVAMLLNKALKKQHTLFFYLIITAPSSVFILLPLGIFAAKVIN